MSTVVHNKLVRDRVPEVISQAGKTAVIEILEDDQEYFRSLLTKLVEEAQEIKVSSDEHLLEELGDIETLVEAILKLKGWTREELMKQKELKDQERGLFDKRIFLQEVKDD